MRESLKEKIQQAERIIQLCLSQHLRPVIACSFGKDSLVVLHMVRKFKEDINIVFNNTGVEYPDTISFYKRLQKEWGLKVVEARPERSFWWIVENYGWPMGPRGYLATDTCCRVLKKRPMQKATRLHGWDLVFDGLTAVESRVRYLNFKRIGQYRIPEKGLAKCSPIAWWTPNDVWDYIEEFDLPYNGFYEKELNGDLTKRGVKVGNYHHCLRVGCWPCTVTLPYGGMRHLRVFYPKLWQFLMLKKGLGKFIMEKKLGSSFDSAQGKQGDLFLGYSDVEGYVKARPCFFDRL